MPLPSAAMRSPRWTRWSAARQHWLVTRDRMPIMPPASMRSRINCFKRVMERGPNNSSAPLLLISYLSIYRKAWQGPPVPHMIQGRAAHGKNLPPLSFIYGPSAVLIQATIHWKIQGTDYPPHEHMDLVQRPIHSLFRSRSFLLFSCHRSLLVLAFRINYT